MIDEQLELLPRTADEILRQLRRRVPSQAVFAPYEATLLAAASQRDAIVPELIAGIDRVAADPARFLKDPEDCLHLFAIYLLAQFREPRALDAFLRFFSLPGEQALDLTGDQLLENGAAVLASVCGGDPAPLIRLAQTETVNEFVREQALIALAVQSLWGERPRDAVVEDLRGFFHTLPRPGAPQVWAALTGLLCDFHVPELAPEARLAFAEGLVDESVLDLAWFEQEMKANNECRAGFRECNAPIDAVAECAAWLCFEDQPEEPVPWEGLAPIDQPYNPADVSGPPPEALTDITPPRPYVAPLKVGRNEPCPCGSGKKYKKCCGK